MRQPEKQGLVEEFIPHAAIGALAEAVLHGLSWRDVVPLGARILRPDADRVRGEPPVPKVSATAATHSRVTSLMMLSTPFNRNLLNRRIEDRLHRVLGDMATEMPELR